jgi:hypothetical protein
VYTAGGSLDKKQHNVAVCIADDDPDVDENAEWRLSEGVRFDDGVNDASSVTRDEKQPLDGVEKNARARSAALAALRGTKCQTPS